MSAEIDAHITRKYEMKKRLGKGVRTFYTEFVAIAGPPSWERSVLRCFYLPGLLLNVKTPFLRLMG